MSVRSRLKLASLFLSLQADLFPAALVYFGSDVKTGPSPVTWVGFKHVDLDEMVLVVVLMWSLSTESYLERHLLESSVSALQADEAIAGSVYH